MTTLDVAVTKEHIAAGVRKEPSMCPVARAVWDALRAAGWSPGMVVTVVNRICVRWSRRNKRWAVVVRTPRLVYARIQRYDRGANIRPFNFSLELPEKS